LRSDENFVIRKKKFVFTILTPNINNDHPRRGEVKGTDDEKCKLSNCQSGDHTKKTHTYSRIRKTKMADPTDCFEEAQGPITSLTFRKEKPQFGHIIIRRKRLLFEETR
jgi:hypothetical protein